MKTRLLNTKPINIQLYVREECTSCEQVENTLRKYCDSRNLLAFEVIDLQNDHLTPNGKSIYITPAVWVNGKLWSFGSFDINRFDERMHQLLKEISN